MPWRWCPCLRFLFRNKGVQPLLDAIVDYMPAPWTSPPSRVTPMTPNEEMDRMSLR